MAEGGASLHILVIDDQPMVRSVITDMLSALGHSVLPTDSGAAALARLRAGAPVDLVLTDLEMPGMNGWQVATEVRHHWPRVPVGVLTGSPELLDGRERRADFIVRKPATLTALHAALRQVPAAPRLESSPGAAA